MKFRYLIVIYVFALLSCTRFLKNHEQSLDQSITKDAGIDQSIHLNDSAMDRAELDFNLDQWSEINTDTTVDQSSDADSGSPDRSILTLNLGSNASFNAQLIKSGNFIRWLFGDGHEIIGNDASYQTTLPTTVDLYLSDSPTTITSFRCTGCMLLDIPTDIVKLSELTNLDIDSNPLFGTIPIELGKLSKLETLDLSLTHLSGSIPSVLGNLAALRSLGLNANELTGTIPTEFGNLLNLEKLNLSQNSLSGTIPTALSNLTKLRILDFHGNVLSGYDVGALAKCTEIEMINLRDNQLTTAVIEEIINDIYSTRATHTKAAKTLDLSGTNESPSAAAQTQIQTLRISFGWTILCNGC